MRSRRDRAARPWYLYLLGAVAVAVIVLAVTEIGPPSSSARTSRELVNAENGVVQSTVSGSGNVEAGTDVTLNFNTSGNLQAVYVKVGQHVQDGQLLATLDPSAAQLQVDQAQAALTAAEDELTEVEDGTATGGGSGSGGSGSSSANASLEDPAATTEFVSYSPGKRKPQTKTKTVTTVTATVTKTVGGNSGGRGSTGNSERSEATTTHTATSTSTTPSPSSIASAQASVYSAEASLRTAQTALANTKLYAPTAGTVASLSSETPGQAVSSSSGTGSSSSSSSSASSGSAATAGSLGGTGSSSSGSGSSSSGFVQIINKNTLTMTVAFSESDVTKVNVGQPATISMDALSGVELGAHVSAISPVGTSSDGVVSYDATLTLDQNNPQVKPGMSATASVIVAQSQGVTVPNQAVTGTGSVGSVEVMKNGKTVSQPVIVGLRGATRTVIQSGLSSGEQVVITITLPSLSATPSTSSGSGTLGGGAGGFGGAGGGGGFRAIFGGGGGGGGGGLRSGAGGFAGGG